MQLNRNNFAELFRADYKTVNVTFDESERGVDGRYASSKSHQGLTHYTYKVPKGLPVKVGDNLLVRVNNGPTFVVKPVTVREVNETPQIDGQASFEYKWIVGHTSDVLHGWNEHTDRDKALKTAVTKLESALERRLLRKHVSEALMELPENERMELMGAFGMSAADLVQPSIEAPKAAIDA